MQSIGGAVSAPDAKQAATRLHKEAKTMTTKIKSNKSANAQAAAVAQALPTSDAQTRGLLAAHAMRAIAGRMSTDASKKACEKAAQLMAAHAVTVGARLPEGWEGTLNRDSGKKLARIAFAIDSGTFYGADPEAAASAKHGKVDGSIPFYLRAMLEGESTRKGMLASAQTAKRYLDAAGAQAGYARQALWLAGIATGNVSSKNAELRIVDRTTALQMLPPEMRAQYEGAQQSA